VVCLTLTRLCVRVLVYRQAASSAVPPVGGNAEALVVELASAVSSSDNLAIVPRPLRDGTDDATLLQAGWPWRAGIYFR
jgi:hypothetical protein